MWLLLERLIHIGQYLEQQIYTKKISMSSTVKKISSDFILNSTAPDAYPLFMFSSAAAA